MAQELAQPEIGARLRAARLARGWTLDDVAEAIHQLDAELGEPESAVDLTHVHKWEAGKRIPGRHYRPRLCVIFEASPAALGFPAGPRLQRDIAALRQRRSDRATGPGGALVHQPGQRAPGAAFEGIDQERLAATMAYLWPVDGPLLDGLERSCRALDRRADLELPAAVWPDLTTFLQAVQHLLSRPHQPSTSERLKTMGARIAHDLAYLAFIQGQQAIAFNHYAVSEVLAREAGDDVELATTLVGKNGVYLPGDMATAVHVTEAASLLLNDRAPSGLASWIWGERAMQEAELGHEAAARRYLDRALDVAVADPAALNLFAPDMPSSWLERRPAVVALKLGRPLEALAMLEDNRARIDPRLTRELVLNHVDAASAWAAAGEIEAACQALLAALAMATGTGNQRSVDQVRRVRDQYLGRWRSEQSVRRLDEALRAAAG